MIQPMSISGSERRSRLSRWLQPGLAVKRWIIVYVLALTLLALGLGLVLTHMYRTAPFPGPVYYLTLQFVPRLWRGLLFLLAGGGLMIWATLRLISSFVGLLVPHYRGRLGDALYAQRILTRGPKVVAIGGGTGLSSLLRGLKEYTSNITAVVTVCDDGGSSGRLRRDLRVLPPGDFRQCIAALADSDPLVTKLFEHRFKSDGGSELKGHAFGNLFIAAMAQITGSFERALEESSRVLAVRGRILPSTLEDVTLCAELSDSSTVQGESLIPERASGGHVGHGDHSEHNVCQDPDVATPANPIRRVFLEPERPAVYPEVVRALLDADLIVIGPGSLFTSILPNLLVDDLARALCWSRAKKIYVCNVATQPGETDGYAVADHVRIIYEHLRERLGIPVGRRDALEVASIPFTHVLVNDNMKPHIPAEWGVTRPDVDEQALADLGVEVIAADVVDESRPTRHDPMKLAAALAEASVPARASARPAPLAAAKALAASLL
jgi:2-phospho-L-lactate transferase/gluconeogenesis factor (CofD/UPF0052 family)